MPDTSSRPSGQPIQRAYTLRPSKTMPDVEFADDPPAVFAAAIKAGHLTHDPSAANFVGDWMYMNHMNGEAAFKHRNRREYRYFRV